MKKVILILAVAMCSLLSYSQTNLMVWNNGRMQYAQPITNIDSITFPASDDMDADTLHLILPRHITYVVHDTVKVYVHDTVYIKQDALKGAFSVSANKQVIFSKGCLQYTQSTNTWEFANEQYEVIGTDNVVGGTVANSPVTGISKSGTALADKIDLFGWSTDNATFSWGISTSSDNSDYSGNFVDWGKNIGDGATWRTLSQDEWVYLFETRVDASSKYGIACIYLNADSSRYANGLILLPDNWTCPSDITFKSGVQSSSYDTYADFQAFTLSQWRQMEQAGAVFIPAAGDRTGTKVAWLQSDGSCFSSTSTTFATGAYILSLQRNRVIPTDESGRNTGRVVRLVQDVK